MSHLHQYALGVVGGVLVAGLLWVSRVRNWVRKQLVTFDLLSEYFKAVRLHFLDIIWGVGVGAAVPYLIFGVYSLFKTPPPLVNWVAIVGALFLAGYYLWRADHVRLIPKMTIMDEARFQWSPETRNDVVVDDRTFVQLLPQCSNDAPLYRCVAYLQRVDRLRDGNWEDSGLDRNLVLGWGGDVELHPQAEKPLNVFFIQHNTHRIIPSLKEGSDIPWAKFDTLLKQEAGLRFYVQVTYSDFINGNFVNIKPVRVYLEAVFGSDRLRPSVRVEAMP